MLKFGSCMRCYLNGKKRNNFSGHGHYVRVPRQTKKELLLSFLRRSPKPSSTDVSGNAVADEWLKATYPAVFEFLYLEKWDDGAARETGTILLFTHDGGLKAALNDRDGSLTAFLSAVGLKDLLGSLNTGLMEGTIEWRRARSFKPGKKK